MFEFAFSLKGSEFEFEVSPAFNEGRRQKSCIHVRLNALL